MAGARLRPGGARVRAGYRSAQPVRPAPVGTAADAGVRRPGATDGDGRGRTVATAAEPKKKDLTVNKLVAGAGAAATSAVLGSFFGAMGTVGGAALGSVFSAVVTWLYQHSLDKTRDTVKARVKLPGGGTVKVASTTEVPAPRGGRRTRRRPGCSSLLVISRPRCVLRRRCPRSTRGRRSRGAGCW